MNNQYFQRGAAQAAFAELIPVGMADVSVETSVLRETPASCRAAIRHGFFTHVHLIGCPTLKTREFDAGAVERHCPGARCVRWRPD